MFSSLKCDFITEIVIFVTEIVIFVTEVVIFVTEVVIRMGADDMDTHEEQAMWNFMSYEEKNHQLYLRQKELLDQFLKTGAISKEQYEKSLHDLTEKMGEEQKN